MPLGVQQGAEPVAHSEAAPPVVRQKGALTQGIVVGRLVKEVGEAAAQRTERQPVGGKVKGSEFGKIVLHAAIISCFPDVSAALGLAQTLCERRAYVLEVAIDLFPGDPSVRQHFRWPPLNEVQKI